MQKIESDSILKEKVMELWGKNGKEFCDEIVDQFISLAKANHIPLEVNDFILGEEMSDIDMDIVVGGDKDRDDAAKDLAKEIVDGWSKNWTGRKF